MKKTRRSMQVADQIRTQLAIILQREVTLPGVGFLTVTDVELSPDLRFARVFISTLDQPEQQKEALAAVTKASSRIRRLLADHARLKYTPELDFRLDATAENARSIEKILHDVLPARPEKEQEDHEDD